MTILNFLGYDFGLYCLNHIQLPLIQTWLHTITRKWMNNEVDNTSLSNFKQFCGLTADLVNSYIVILKDADSDITRSFVTLTLHQCLLVFIECVSISNGDDSVSRLGCACLK